MEQFKDYVEYKEPKYDFGLLSKDMFDSYLQEYLQNTYEGQQLVRNGTVGYVDSKIQYFHVYVTS